MCAIVGAVLHNIDTYSKVDIVNNLLNEIMRNSTARGRDGWGVRVVTAAGVHNQMKSNTPVPNEYIQYLLHPVGTATIIANLRAEPTTEYVKVKSTNDQQPYTLADKAIVHNGTIANDKQLRTYRYPTDIDSAAVIEQLAETDIFIDAINTLQGSFAILSQDPNVYQLHYACNYRPLWVMHNELGSFIASSSDYLPTASTMLQPYTYGAITSTNTAQFNLHKASSNQKALVVCSGGLDSTVAATLANETHDSIDLLHFTYGCRAEANEVKAVRAVAEYFNCNVIEMPINVYNPSDSKLLQADDSIAGGEAGAEFAHEWVPARNLLMLALATAHAEVHNYTTIVLGNNLEEAGAYPDNEPEFVKRFDQLLPFAVGANKELRVIMPVGNMMKHEIVAAGLKHNAPMHLTWSCYRNRDKHCGKCGPCFMRKTAFEINQQNEVIEYL